MPIVCYTHYPFLYMAMCYKNIKLFKSIKINDLLENYKIKADFSDFLNNNQIKIFNSLKEWIGFVL